MGWENIQTRDSGAACVTACRSNSTSVSGIDTAVRPGQIRLCDLEIEDGLANGIVFRLDDLLRFVLVGRLQARPLAGGFIYGVVHPATDATEDESVSRIHIFNTRAEIGLSGRINQ